MAVHAQLQVLYPVPPCFRNYWASVKWNVNKNVYSIAGKCPVCKTWQGSTRSRRGRHFRAGAEIGAAFEKLGQTYWIWGRSSTVGAAPWGRWVTERDRLRRWGAKLSSSLNAQRNRCDFLQDLHPNGISCFQRLVPERWLSSRKTRSIKLTSKPKKHIEIVTKHIFWRRWIDQFWSLTKHVSYMTSYINWRT